MLQVDDKQRSASTLYYIWTLHTEVIFPLTSTIQVVFNTYTPNANIAYKTCSFRLLYRTTYSNLSARKLPSSRRRIRFHTSVFVVLSPSHRTNRITFSFYLQPLYNNCELCSDWFSRRLATGMKTSPNSCAPNY